jgi:hypothetical protein
LGHFGGIFGECTDIYCCICAYNTWTSSCLNINRCLCNSHVAQYEVPQCLTLYFQHIISYLWLIRCCGHFSAMEYRLMWTWKASVWPQDNHWEVCFYNSVIAVTFFINRNSLSGLF